MKHTQGEWIKTPAKHAVSGTFGVKCNGLWIAKCHPFNGDTVGIDEAQANAAFIVHACNNHGALLEACKEAKKYLEPDLVEPGRTVFWKLVAALQTAQGGTP